MADNFYIYSTILHKFEDTPMWLLIIAQFVNYLYYKEYELWQVGDIKITCLGVSSTGTSNIYRYT